MNKEYAGSEHKSQHELRSRSHVVADFIKAGKKVQVQ